MGCGSSIQTSAHDPDKRDNLQGTQGIEHKEMVEQTPPQVLKPPESIEFSFDPQTLQKKETAQFHKLKSASRQAESQRDHSSIQDTPLLHQSWVLRPQPQPQPQPLNLNNDLIADENNIQNLPINHLQNEVIIEQEMTSQISIEKQAEQETLQVMQDISIKQEESQNEPFVQEQIKTQEDVQVVQQEKKSNLIEILRKKREDKLNETTKLPITTLQSQNELEQKNLGTSQINTAIQSQTIKNPKTNLIALLHRKQQEKVEVPDIPDVPEEASTPQSDLNFNNKIRKFYEFQGSGSNILSPIYRSMDEFPQKISSEESNNLIPIIRGKAIQIQIPTKRESVLQKMNTLSNHQTSFIESPQMEKSFIVQEENLSKIDLDDYNIRVENVEVSYEQQELRLNRSNSQYSEISQGRLQNNYLSPFSNSFDRTKINQFLSPKCQTDHMLAPPLMHAGSLNSSSQVLPQTPTYADNNQIHEFMSNGSGTQRSPKCLLPQQLSMDNGLSVRHPSFSVLDQVNVYKVQDQDKVRSADINNKALNNQQLTPKPRDDGKLLKRKFSGVNHIPIETSVLEKSVDEKGQKKINNFIIMQELGRGAQAKVRLIYDSNINCYYVNLIIIHVQINLNRL